MADLAVPVRILRARASGNMPSALLPGQIFVDEYLGKFVFPDATTTANGSGQYTSFVSIGLKDVQAGLTAVRSLATGGTGFNAASVSDLLTKLGLVAVATSGSASDLSAGTLAAVRLPALTGDVTSSSGSAATTLSTSGVTAGSYVLPTVTFDAKGRATAATQGVLTGDVTTAAGSLATTIAANAVTNAKAAQMATLTLKGNITGATANAADVTPSALLDAAFGSTQGMLLYRGASGWAALGAGTAGYLLTAGGAGANPSWAAAAAAGAAFIVTGRIAKSAAFTASDANGTLYDLTGSFAATLPAASGASATAPLWRHFRKRDGSGACTLALTGSDTWEDGTTAPKSLYQEACTVYSLGGGVWFFAPGTRQRGWIDVGAFSATAGASVVSVTAGAGDAEIRDIEVAYQDFVPAASDTLTLRVQQGGTSGNLKGASNTNGTNSAINTTSASLSNGSDVSPVSGRIAVQNIQSATASTEFCQFTSIVGTSLIVGAVTLSAAGAFSGLTLSTSSSTYSTMRYNVRLYRP